MLGQYLLQYAQVLAVCFHIIFNMYAVRGVFSLVLGKFDLTQCIH